MYAHYDPQCRRLPFVDSDLVVPIGHHGGLVSYYQCQQKVVADLTGHPVCMGGMADNGSSYVQRGNVSRRYRFGDSFSVSCGWAEWQLHWQPKELPRKQSTFY